MRSEGFEMAFDCVFDYYGYSAYAIIKM